MPFMKPEELQVGECYVLQEFIDSKDFTPKQYYLVGKESDPKDTRFPILLFSRGKGLKPDVFFKQGRAQFGDPTWRRAFKGSTGYEIYDGPLGTQTWNWSWVEIQPVAK